MKYLEKNMEALRKRDPGLASYIESADEKPFRAKESVAEAHESARYIVLNAQGVMALIGFGNGAYALELLAKCREGHYLVIYEADPGAFKHALGLRDFSGLFLHQSVILLIGEIDDFSFVHFLHETMTNGNLFMIKNKDALSRAEEKIKTRFDSFYTRFVEEKKFWDCNMGTQISIGKAFINSIMENIPSILKSYSSTALKDVCTGIPAIIVSAGPSVDGEIENLKRAKGRALIIAVDAIWPVLHKNGIEPDLVVGIDPLKDNEALFKELPECPFVCMSQYTPTVLQKFVDAGKKFFITGQEGNPMYNWLYYFWEDKGAGACFGGSVSHYAMEIAELMGCTTMALVGQDLSFTSKIHAGDITKQLHDHMNLEVPDETVGAIKMKNKLGEEVCTKQTYLSFKLAFENKIRCSPYLSVANLTQQGLKIEGAEDITFDEFLESCPQEIENPITMIDYDPIYRIVPLVQRLDEGIKIYSRVRRAALLIIRLIHRAREARVNKQYNKVREITKRIEKNRPHTQHPLLYILSAYHYHLELYLRKKEITDIDTIKDKWKRYDLQLDRGVNFYGELEEGVRLFLEKVIPVRDKLKEEYGDQIRSESYGNARITETQGARSESSGHHGQPLHGSLRQMQG